jgi:hypothetical protein
MGAEILNEVTGEAALTDKTGRKYHVVFDLNAVMALESIVGRSAISVISAPDVTSCVAMILAGSGGYQRRNPGGRKINANLAQKIFLDSGGLVKLAPVLVESLSCAEGLGLNGGDDDAGADEGEAGPLVSPPS